jgi:hypothetical protein
VLTAALKMHRDYFVKTKDLKNEREKVVVGPKIWETLCKQFHLSQTTVTNIIQKYLLHKKVYISGKYFIRRSGNSSPKTAKFQKPRPSWLPSEILFITIVLAEKVNVLTGSGLFGRRKNITVPVDALGLFQVKVFNLACLGLIQG